MAFTVNSPSQHGLLLFATGGAYKLKYETGCTIAAVPEFKFSFEEKRKKEKATVQMLGCMGVLQKLSHCLPTVFLPKVEEFPDP